MLELINTQKYQACVFLDIFPTFIDMKKIWVKSPTKMQILQLTVNTESIKNIHFSHTLLLWIYFLNG